MTKSKLLDPIINQLSIESSEEQATDILGNLLETSLKESLQEQDIVDRIFAALEKPDSFSKPKIWRLFRYLDMHSWELLRRKQQAFVMAYLRDHWGKFRDWMGTFVACEILGARDPSRSMLEFFKNAINTIPPVQNALGCYGLQVVACATNDAAVAESAMAILKSHVDHPEEEVQKEARLALDNIAKKWAGRIPNQS